MKKNKGQVVLIMLVITTAVMTVGLALTRRSVVQTKINTDDALLKQAFNNAESGIDYFLRTSNTTYKSTSGEVASISVETIADKDKMLGKYIWLIGHKDDGSLDKSVLYGGRKITVKIVNPKFMGSLKIDYFYLDTSNNYKVIRLGYNYTADKIKGYSNISKREFDLIPSSGETPIFLVITPLFGETEIEFNGDAKFPNQGVDIVSTGTKDGVKSIISTSKRFEIPPFFLDAIVAGGDIKTEN